jgi:hypothetical protein
MYKGEPGDDGEEPGVIATVQVLYAIGWKEHETQQKPDSRGAAGGNKIGGEVPKVEKTG